MDLSEVSQVTRSLPECDNGKPEDSLPRDSAYNAAKAQLWFWANAISAGVALVAIIGLVAAVFHERPLPQRFEIVSHGELVSEFREWQEDKATLWPLAVEFQTTNMSLIYEISDINFHFARLKRLKTRSTDNFWATLKEQYERETKNPFFWHLVTSNRPHLTLVKVLFDENSYKYDPIQRILTFKMYVEVNNTHPDREPGIYGGFLNVQLYVLPVGLARDKDRNRKVKYVILLDYMDDPWIIFDQGVIRK